MTKFVERFGTEGQSCLIFQAPDSCSSCIDFVSSPLRLDNVVPAEKLLTRVFDVDGLGIRLYVVFFPASETPKVIPFWQHPGVGISTRIVEDTLENFDSVRDVTGTSVPAPMLVEVPEHQIIRERIADLLERAPLTKREKKVSSGDVYLFETGMSGIYNTHRHLNIVNPGTTVLFGFAFHSTIHVLDDYSSNYKFFGGGSAAEIDQLEAFIAEEAKEGRKIQAVWAEFPCNPSLITPDLTRLRKLADAHHFALIIDDTISSFCNVDVLPVADVIVTSLTKSFSGYADVMAGSAVLNPQSPIYKQLKESFNGRYHNYLYKKDAVVLEKNSRSYIERSTILNNNALAIADYLQSKALDPSSSVTKVLYPSVSDSLPNYRAYMRPATADYTPGYGCLLSFEFDNIDSTIAFYNNINAHLGPHLGAHRTLIMPYVKLIYGKAQNNVLEWAKEYGMKESQLRVSVGLEDQHLLVEDFRQAIDIVDQIKTRSN